VRIAVSTLFLAEVSNTDEVLLVIAGKKELRKRKDFLNPICSLQRLKFKENWLE